MSALADLQRQFLRGLLEGDERAAEAIRGTAHFSVQQRLSVYANAYRRRLVEALAAVHERCVQRLGEKDFDALALAYVEAHAPNHRSLGRYGADFPAWLRARDNTLALAAGVATIDAGLRRAFDAADAEPIDRAALLALPVEAWAALRFAWVPALAIGRVEAAAIEHWREPARPDGASGVGSSHAQAMLATPDAMTDIAFWRRDGQTFFRSMAPSEALLITRLRAGACLSDASADKDAPVPLEVAVPALLAWVDDGWVAGVRPAAPATPCRSLLPTSRTPP